MCRQKKKKEGDSNATIVSESIPFMQYDLHRQLLYKLRIYGFNAIFGLKFQISIGESMMTAVATGTAMFVKSLPPPPPLKVMRNLEVLDEEDERLLELQKRIMATSEANRRVIEGALVAGVKESLSQVSLNDEDIDSGSESESEDSDAENDRLGSANTAASGIGARNMVVQIDDATDEDLLSVLLDPTFGPGFKLLNIEAHSLDVDDEHVRTQMITVFKQGFIDPSSQHPNRQLASIFRKLYEELKFQLSYYQPCVIAGIDYDIQLPKENEVQIRLTAIAMGQVKSEIAQSDPPCAVPVGEAPGQPNGLLAKRMGMPDLDFSDVWKVLNLTRRSSVQRQSIMGSMLGNKDTLSNPPQLPPLRNSLISALMDLKSMVTQPSANSFDNRGTNLSIDSIGEEMVFDMDEDEDEPGSKGSPASASAQTSAADLSNQLSNMPPLESKDSPNHLKAALTASLLNPIISAVHAASYIDITPLSYLPNASIARYLGRLSLHFVKEASINYESPTGGMSAFCHAFLTEVNAIIRAHCAALGGNALIAFSIDQSMFEENLKNQGYAFLSISGDVVEVKYKDGVCLFLFFKRHGGADGGFSNAKIRIRGKGLDWKRLDAIRMVAALEHPSFKEHQ